MPHKPIAVVVAMRRELASFLRGNSAISVNGVEVFELASAVVAVGGIGKAAAQRAATALATTFTPDVMVSAGIAGALSDDLHVGDVIYAHEVVDAATGRHFAATGDAGIVVTATSVSGTAEKRSLASRWHADMVDMEASAVAQVARDFGIEFAAVKAVSDELSFMMPPVGNFVDQAGQFETLRFAAFLALRPKWWGTVRELNANARTASVKLSGSVQHLIDQRSQTAQEGNTVKA
jgi:adenosylhomocysteine nucleosidase